MERADVGKLFESWESLLCVGVEMPAEGRMFATRQEEPSASVSMPGFGERQPWLRAYSDHILFFLHKC